MPSEAQQFYDSLADSYHLIFEDWDRAIARQAGVLDALRALSIPYTLSATT